MIHPILFILDTIMFYLENKQFLFKLNFFIEGVILVQLLHIELACFYTIKNKLFSVNKSKNDYVHYLFFVFFF